MGISQFESLFLFKKKTIPWNPAKQSKKSLVSSSLHSKMAIWYTQKKTRPYENAKLGRYIRSNEPSVYEKYLQTLFPFSQNLPSPTKVLVRCCIICPKFKNKDIRTA